MKTAPYWMQNALSRERYWACPPPCGMPHNRDVRRCWFCKARRPKPPRKPAVRHCRWRVDYWTGPWKTGCGMSWNMIEDGGPAENGVRFCPRCGKPVREWPPERKAKA